MEFVLGKNPIKTLKRVFLVVVFLYIVCGSMLFLFQRNFIYFPTDKDFWSCKISDTNNQKILANGERALFAQADPQAQSSRIVVFYHGNADSACNWRYIPRHFGFAGDDTLVVEYPGYAGDTRAITKENMFATVEHIKQWVDEQEYEQVYLVSFSLGGATASYHASLGEVDRLLMFAPFDELIGVIHDRHLYYPRFLLHDDYSNIDLLLQSETEVVIMHGTADKVVHPRRSARLGEELGGQLLVRTEVPGVGHKNLLEGNPFNQIIDRFLLE